MYLLNRYYDPATAQYLSVDPLDILTRNPYLYAQADPLNRTDPTGLVGTLPEQAQADAIASNLSGEADVSVQGALDTIRSIVNSPGEALSTLADNISTGARAALDQARITIAEVNNALDEIPGLRTLMNLNDAKTLLTDAWTCRTSALKTCFGHAVIDVAAYGVLKGIHLDDANALGFSVWLTTEGITDALTESFDRLGDSGKAAWCNALGFQ